MADKIKDKNELIIEFGTEEMPNRFLISARQGLRTLTEELFRQFNLPFKKIETFFTPRRILIFITGLPASQADTVMEKQGPPKAVFFQGETVSETGKKFMLSHKITIQNIQVKETPKGSYVFIHQVLKGKNTTEVLKDLVPQVLKKIHLFKSMSWDSSGLEFIRPIRWLVVVYNGKTVPVRLGNLSSTSFSFGHKYLSSNKKIAFKSISQAKTILKKNHVLFDPEERESLIQKEIKKLIKAGLSYHPDPDLLAEVAHLVEYPFVQMCEFPEKFLDIPEEFISTCIIHHQRAFPVFKNKKLTNKFIIVLNNKPNQNTRNGNERVLKARLNDTCFFFEEDKKQNGLAGFNERLKKILFLNDLGTLFHRVERLKSAAEALSGMLSLTTEDRARAVRTAELSKADLTTSIVYEFPELQGIAGMIYARLFKENEQVALGISEHYLPRKSGDDYPTTLTGIVTGLADKFDHIIGAFIKDLIPTGSEDPFQVRRSCLAIINIIIKNKLHLPVKGLLDLVYGLYRNQNLVRDASRQEAQVNSLITYLKTRFRTVLEDMGYAYDEIDSILSLENDDVYDLFLRIKELSRFRKDVKFKALFIGLKRMANIIKGMNISVPLDPALFQEQEEKDLYELFKQNQDAFRNAVASRDYSRAFLILAGYKEKVDLFFDKVLVMTKDEKIKNNRLALLLLLVSDFRRLLDFSRLAEKI